MSGVDRWLLPDGMGDVLPPQARQIEQLRRQLLDLYHSWGYELIIPPLMEFTESLLIGSQKDIDLQTFKVTDQLSGRMMGIRADITPQAARIDAHGLNREGAVRLCYAGSVLHTRPVTALASRSPLQVGVECFGIAGSLADIEVISLMIETLLLASIDPVVISLGHVEVFRALVQEANFNVGQIETLYEILQRKASGELAEFLKSSKVASDIGQYFQQLVSLNGDVAILSDARRQLGRLRSVASALAELEVIATGLAARYPQVRFHVDLAEVPGYHYHNGIVFAAYTQGAGAAIANGGRYDAVGEVFGRARPATGFNTDLKTLLNLSGAPIARVQAILVRQTEDPRQWSAITELRASGEQVICVGAGDCADVASLACARELVCEHDQYVVKWL
jgi:ATP phosphoribosyltransferase regulatory subunit